MQEQEPTQPDETQPESPESAADAPPDDTVSSEPSQPQSSPGDSVPVEPAPAPGDQPEPEHPTAADQPDHELTGELEVESSGPNVVKIKVDRPGERAVSAFVDARDTLNEIAGAMGWTLDIQEPEQEPSDGS